ncbi:electron transport complex, RnfABCDGE type, E subunit [Magnetococcus marinus MC-1]|uniref:Ion-translocating oxidoreductase complex subunit E n=1 Tax=Magnetococcus marinus (strain ATCC BAA-1437 / JCM 17883 / MC-1) TaxID=156889 RepID=A0L5G3_MAGMM|nr:RnfABCDGE type electron transport complex subunit E [Magnetococcus marinus]ABK43206.1 electron transport complex, RnfABCDGE type, E subunit [Magnetococcus marinus MC-1]
MSEITNREIVANGFWNNNAVFAQLLGMCPLLGVTTTAMNGIGMGLASLVVLLGANVVVAMVRSYIPSEVRIPSYIVVIASFVTIVDLCMNAWLHDLHKILGLFIPLIVVNCAILGRAEAFASRNSVGKSAIDGIATGLGFTFALFVLGAVREILGAGEIFGYDVMSWSGFHPALGFVLPPGAFIALGFILMGVKWLNERRELAAAKKPKQKRASGEAVGVVA